MNTNLGATHTNWVKTRTADFDGTTAGRFGSGITFRRDKLDYLSDTQKNCLHWAPELIGVDYILTLSLLLVVMIGFKEIQGINYCRNRAFGEVDVDDAFETTIKIKGDLKQIYLTETDRLRISQFTNRIKFVTVFDKIMEVILLIMAEEFQQAKLALHGRPRHFN
ncbi:hypothetical protein ACTXT7_015159 [Hymenolepis weldensis]